MRNSNYLKGLAILLKFIPCIIGIYIVPPLKTGWQRENMTSPGNILKLLKIMKQRSTKSKQKAFNYPLLSWRGVIRISAGIYLYNLEL